MHVHVQLRRTWHVELLRAAARRSWVSHSRYPAATPGDAQADGPPRGPARTRWLRVRRPGGPSAAPEAAGLPLIFQREAARWLPAWQAAWPSLVVAVRQIRDDPGAGLVLVRDQERRRLRRELHDGLGPTLAGLMLGLDTARVLSAGRPDLEHLLGRLAMETQRAVTDLRRVVYGLRPPALDELGLAGSLQDQVGRLRCAAPALAVNLDVPGDGLTGLPTAAEVACYRIVTEALTNVARHAYATRCTVRIQLNHGLRIDVRDNGVGLPAGWRAGAGVASMRERACELGGHLVIKPCRPQGTRITALLPLREPP
jgi:two-component system, NarL family, sensor kinase